HIDLPGDGVFRHACKLGLDGIVSKRVALPLRPIERLAQVQEPGGTSGEARGGRGLEWERAAMTTTRYLSVSASTCGTPTARASSSTWPDYTLALTAYRAAVERWPGAPITLRQGARVIEDSRRLRLAWLTKAGRGL